MSKLLIRRPGMRSVHERVVSGMTSSFPRPGVCGVTCGAGTNHAGRRFTQGHAARVKDLSGDVPTDGNYPG